MLERRRRRRRRREGVGKRASGQVSEWVTE
jgi:hypothetical protein